jgi:hypothetical protein
VSSNWTRKPDGIYWGVALYGRLEIVFTLYARLDGAASRGRDREIEQALVGSVSGDMADKVAHSLRAGNKLMPPTAMTQLAREVIEWCSDADLPQADGGAAEVPPALAAADLIHLVISINGEHDQHPAFPSGDPTAEELKKYNDEFAGDPQKLLQEASRMMLWEFARMQANAITIRDLLLSDTYEMWFKGWPKRAPHDLIGDTPVDAFLAATGVPLREVIKWGLRLWEDSKTGEVVFTKSSLLARSPDAGVVNRMLKTASLPLAKYRKRLAAERNKGNLAHRRYTFGERPLLQLGGDEFIVLRPAWIADRFCGPQLYWEEFSSFGEQEDPRAAQFSQGMNYVFERNVDYLFRRASRRAGGTISLITEEEMQHSWTTGGAIPSVCDWVLVSGRFCLLVDATNHWLDANLAQGLA